MNAAGSLSKDVGIKNACDALVIPRASFYRWCGRDKHSMKGNCRPMPPLALTCDERKDVLGTLHEERFVDQSPQPIFVKKEQETAFFEHILWHHKIFS